MGSLTRERSSESLGDGGDGVATARGPAQSSTRLPHAAISANLARRFVAATLHGWGSDAQAEVAVLLVGELVTNAVAHTTSTTIGLVVRRSDDAVRVEVHDSSPELPNENFQGTWDDQGGRGLRLVAELASRWGVDAAGRGAGKVVWFEVLTG
jgi:anti-sigma regulatory factor (Ser/Thr protein kinase)